MNSPARRGKEGTGGRPPRGPLRQALAAVRAPSLGGAHRSSLPLQEALLPGGQRARRGTGAVAAVPGVPRREGREGQSWSMIGQALRAAAPRTACFCSDSSRRCSSTTTARNRRSRSSAWRAGELRSACAPSAQQTPTLGGTPKGGGNPGFLRSPPGHFSVPSGSRTLPGYVLKRRGKTCDLLSGKAIAQFRAS